MLLFNFLPVRSGVKSDESSAELINTNDNFNLFYENVISSSFIPNITLPTRMCDTTSTLIDNIYTNSVDKNCTSGILIRPISDHQMYFCMINSNFGYSDQAKKLIEVEVCDHESIQRFITEISNDNIYNKLQRILIQIRITIMKFY